MMMMHVNTSIIIEYTLHIHTQYNTFLDTRSILPFLSYVLSTGYLQIHQITFPSFVFILQLTMMIIQVALVWCVVLVIVLA